MATGETSLLVPTPSSHIIYNKLPVDASQLEIRLLDISPGSGQEPLICTLRCATIRPGLTYLALSYAWGPLDAPQLPVNINGLDSPVGQNLYAALQQLRRPSSPVSVWADAVCIDQANTPERNAQVGIMRDIYSAASQVPIWLGEGNEATDHAIDALQQLVARSAIAEFVLNDLRMLLPDSMQPWNAPLEKREARIKSIRAGLNDIFTRPWWDRTWTVQELALARDCPLLMCGSSSICFECFVATNDILGWFLAKQNRADEASDFWALTTLQSALDQHKPSSLSVVRNYAQAARHLGSDKIMASYLSRLLFDTQHSLSTDPRDKIFGLLGIAEPEALEAIGIDYGASVLEVYTKATMYLIRRGGFQILSMQGLRPLTEGWPSWVVDFRRSASPNYKPLVRYYDRHGSKYCPLPFSEPEEVASFRRDSVLRVNAIPIGRIIETSPNWGQSSEPPNNVGMIKLLVRGDAIRVFLNAAQPCLDCSSPRDDSERDRCRHPSYGPQNSARPRQPLRDAVYRTLIGGWVDPTRRYDARPAGPTSDAHLKALQGILHDIVDNRECLEALEVVDPAEEGGQLSGLEFESQVALVLERMLKWMNGRVAFRLDSGWIGVGPPYTQAGDMVLAVLGADVPFVIRPSGVDTDARVRLVGECYVDGIMFDECTTDPHFRTGGDMERGVQLYPFDIC